jgi:hypothetical protein
MYPKGYMINLNLNVIHEENLGWKVNKRGKAAPVNSKFPYGSNSKPSQKNTLGTLSELENRAEDAAVDAELRERLNAPPKPVSDAAKAKINAAFSNINSNMG